MDYKKLELKLRQAMESAIEKGWAPNPVITLSPRGTCCAVGSLLVDKAYFEDGLVFGDDNYEEQVAKKLRVPIDAVRSVWAGFDYRNDKYERSNKKAYEIGANIRRIYCDDNGQVE